jgi:hypothetical protein
MPMGAAAGAGCCAELEVARSKARAIIVVARVMTRLPKITNSAKRYHIWNK